MDRTLIKKRLLKGSTINVVLLAFNIGVSFWMMPFLIHTLGDRWYGFWALSGTIIGYYGFLDLGLSSAVCRFVSRAYGRNDLNEMNVIINTSLFVYSILAALAVIVTIAVTVSIPYLVEVQEEIPTYQIVMLILGIDIAISFPMRAFTGVLNSKIRYDLNAIIQLLKLAVRTILIFYYLDIGYGILALTFITVGVNLLGYILNYYFVRREFPEMEFRRSLVKSTAAKPLFSFSKYSFIARTAEQMRFRIDAFVIAGAMSLSAVTVYYIATRLIEYFHQLIYSSMGILESLFSQYESRGEVDGIRNLLLRSLTLTSTASFYIGGCILFYGKYFIVAWMGKDYSASYTVLAILCIAVVMELAQLPSVNMMFGIFRHKYFAVANSAEGIINLALSIILVKTHGLIGVAAATLMSTVIFKLALQPFYASKAIDLPVTRYYKTILSPLVKLAPAMMLFFYLAENYIDYSYASIFSIAGIQLVLFAPYVYLFVLGREERAFFRHAVRPA